MKNQNGQGHNQDSYSNYNNSDELMNGGNQLNDSIYTQYHNKITEDPAEEFAAYPGGLNTYDTKGTADFPIAKQQGQND